MCEASAGAFGKAFQEVARHAAKGELRRMGAAARAHVEVTKKAVRATGELEAAMEALRAELAASRREVDSLGEQLKQSEDKVLGMQRSLLDAERARKPSMAATPPPPSAPPICR